MRWQRIPDLCELKQSSHVVVTGRVNAVPAALATFGSCLHRLDPEVPPPGADSELPGILVRERVFNGWRDGSRGKGGCQCLREFGRDVLRIGFPYGVREGHSGKVEGLLLLGRPSTTLAREAHESERDLQRRLGAERGPGPLAACGNGLDVVCGHSASFPFYGSSRFVVNDPAVAGIHATVFAALMSRIRGSSQLRGEVPEGWWERRCRDRRRGLPMMEVLKLPIRKT